MKPLETSLHYILLTELENRAMSRGYFYDLLVVRSLLLPTYVETGAGQGKSPVAWTDGVVRP